MVTDENEDQSEAVSEPAIMEDAPKEPSDPTNDNIEKSDDASQEATTKASRIKVVPLSKISDKPELVESTVSEQSSKDDSNKEGKTVVEVTENSQAGNELKIKQEVTDEDFLNGLDALESCFENCSPDDFLNGFMDDSNDSKDKVQVKEESQLEEGEIPPRMEEFETIEQMTKEEKLQMIYADKLKTKELVAKERLKNFAKTLETTYPVYKELLEKVEKENGVQFCKLEEPKHAPWNVRHTNRWKLKCNKLVVREENPSLAGPGLEKPIKKIEWHITSLAADVNIEDDPVFPPFIVNIVKKFEDFLNTNQLIQTFSIKQENLSGPKSEFTAMMIRANRENQVMCVMVGNHLKSEMMTALKKYFTPLLITHNITSLYCKSYTVQNNIPNNSTTTFLLGQHYLLETINNIKIELTPRSNYWTNAYGLEVLVKTINDFFTPVLENTTLLEIGCGIGLMSLLFTSRYARVIGIDSSSEIDEAETNRQRNNNDKVLFLRENENNIQLFFDQLKKADNVNAIINNNSVKIGRSTEVLANVRRLNSVKRLVFLGSFNRHSTTALLELMSPTDNLLGNLPFVPVKACIVDSIPDSDHFDIVMLMQRRAVRSQPSTEENVTQEVAVTAENKATQPTNIIENVKEQQKLLEQATLKLSSGSISSELAEELKNLINTLRQKTNNLQTQLPLITTPAKPATTTPVDTQEQPSAKKDEPPKTDSGPILRPGASKKYQINLQPLEPSGRMAGGKRRFVPKHQQQPVNPPIEKPPMVVPPPVIYPEPVPPIHLQQPVTVQIPHPHFQDPYHHAPPVGFEQSRSPRSWRSNSPSYPSGPRKLRPISPVCLPAFDLKRRVANAPTGFKTNSPESENWDDDDEAPPPRPVLRHREDSWDEQSNTSHSSRSRHYRRHSRDYSPDYDRRHSRSPRRRCYSRSTSRSRSRSLSYGSGSRSRSRSYSRSRSRSRSPYSKKRRYSPHSSKRHSSPKHKSRSSKKRDKETRYSSSPSPTGPVPPRDTPPIIPPPPKHSPPNILPAMAQQYLVNGPMQMPLQMQMPVQMPIQMPITMPMQMTTPLNVPIKGVIKTEIPWNPQEIEFSPTRMPICVVPKTTEHYVSSSSIETSNIVTDSPLSPNAEPPRVEENVRDPRLRGKLKTEEPSTLEENQDMPLTGWVNGNGVAVTPEIQWQQQQMLNGHMMGSNSHYLPWMRMPSNYPRPSHTPGPPNSYMMQSYWGYTSGSHGPHGASGPPMGVSGSHMSQMMANGGGWQGSPNFGPNFPNSSQYPN